MAFAEAYIEHLDAIAPAVAGAAGDCEIVEGAVPHAVHAATVASIAGSIGRIKAEVAGFIGAHPRLGQLGEEAADGRQEPGVGRGVGTRAAADWPLVYSADSLDVLNARAEKYGLTVDEYKRRNLLATEISSDDVARAILAMADKDFAKSTGMQLTIDGGNERTL